jgi:hypothetical protein
VINAQQSDGLTRLGAPTSRQVSREQGLIWFSAAFSRSTSAGKNGGADNRGDGYTQNRHSGETHTRLLRLNCR